VVLKEQDQNYPEPILTRARRDGHDNSIGTLLKNRQRGRSQGRVRTADLQVKLSSSDVLIP